MTLQPVWRPEVAVDCTLASSISSPAFGAVTGRDPVRQGGQRQGFRCATPAARARQLLDGLPRVPYVESRPDAVLAARARCPRRGRISRALGSLDTYVGRGSAKFGLDRPDWYCPFVIGKDGDRDACLNRFADYVVQSSHLQARLPELQGQVLRCHSADHEPCHADILMAAYMEHCESMVVQDDLTSDEDEQGYRKAPAGAGWLGRGGPLSVGRGLRARGLQDGGGLCSPGRSPAESRVLPPGACQVSAIISDVLDAMEVASQKPLARGWLATLSCGRVSSDPFGGADRRVKEELERLLASHGFVRDAGGEQPSEGIDFQLLSALAHFVGDPCARLGTLYRHGVRLGHKRRMPRTPAVFPRKSRWNAHVGREVVEREFVANYRSAAELEAHLATTVDEYCVAGMMVPVSLGEAREIYGDRLRVAALGAVGPPGSERIIHDATHHVGVNGAIRVRDQDETPLHSDAVAALDHSTQTGHDCCFGFAFDVSRAQRGVADRTGGLGLAGLLTAIA